MLLLGLPGTMLILHRKLRPVSVITDALKQADLENLDLSIPVKSRNEFGYLAETIEVMGSKLGDAQRHLLEKDRIARELEIAQEIQTNILPRNYPQAPEIEFAGAYQSAREIGGDYYDFLEIDENRLAFLVADVSGKSLPGMLVMLLTRDIVRQQRRLHADPVALLSSVNRELRQNIRKGMFVTMFYGVVDRSTGTVNFASAGHNPLIHMDQSGERLDLIKTKGFPLGLMPSEQFEQRIELGRVHLRPGDWLIQYTDGINEAQNTVGEEFGMERFTDLLKISCHGQATELVQATLARLREFVAGADQYDDITLLTMNWVGVPTDSSKLSTSEVVSCE
jgi:sigma-B regulation protein RsbU (phosphoserine phosphatase)